MLIWSMYPQMRMIWLFPLSTAKTSDGKLILASSRRITPTTDPTATLRSLLKLTLSLKLMTKIQSKPIQPRPIKNHNLEITLKNSRKLLRKCNLGDKCTSQLKISQIVSYPSPTILPTWMDSTSLAPLETRELVDLATLSHSLK